MKGIKRVVRTIPGAYWLVNLLKPEGPRGVKKVGHRRYVGGLWDEMGRMQFEFLTSRGLQSYHTLIDVACGSLRAGVHLIPYLERHEGVALKMVEILCQKLRSTDVLLEDNTTLAMGPKLARGLLRLVADHGVEKEGGLGLSFRIKQSELGNYVALSRENVNRQLQEWAASGLIDLSRGQVSVLDAEALSEIAENIE